MVQKINIKYTLFIRAFILLIGLLVCMPGVKAQSTDQILVKGLITDTTGTPLIGVTVMVVETSKGMLTDYNGNFSIDVKKGNTLRFSYLGYKSQDVIVSSSDIKISLTEDRVNLDEVVVVAIGYGTARKSDLTGAISSVSSEKFNKGVISTSEQLIQGKIAGVTVVRSSGDPTQGASVRLRGGTSLTAGSGPLYVVDGVPGVDLNTISPNDIETMDVLKDASAAAIYGSRGANGVILVTTKKAKAGRMNTNYSSYVAIGEVAKNLDLLSANQFRQVMRDSANVPAYKGKMVDYGGNTDWQKEVERTAVTYSHSLSIDGGTEKTSYRGSLNYLNNQGVIINSDLQRVGANLGVNHKTLNDKLNIEMSLSATRDDYTPTNYDIFSRVYFLNPTIPVKDEDGKYTQVDGITYENPVAMVNNTTQDESRLRFLGFTKFDLEIFQGLKATLNLSYTLNSHQNRYYRSSEDKYGSQVGGNASRALDENSNKQLETYLNYTKSFNDFTVNGMGGYSYLYSMAEGFGAAREQFVTDLFSYNNLGAGVNAKQSDVYSYKNESKLISFFGRLNLNYKSRYMLTATLRSDGSSKFGANHKWGYFPSASLAWRISDESFMSWSSSFLNNLKFRAGYGVTGNQEAIDPYKSLVLYGKDPEVPSLYYDYVSGTWKQAIGIIQNSNPNLKWEETSQLNIGFDFTVMDRISGTIEYYDKTTNDLLYNYAVRQPPYPYKNMLANVGTLSNKGIEGNLNIQILQGSEFTWSLDVNAAKNVQKIDKLSNDEFSTTYTKSSNLIGKVRGASDLYTQRIQEGYVVGTFYGKVFDKFVNGEFTFKDLNGDGKINDDDQTVLGDAQPDFTLGFGMNFGYKGFDFSFFMNGIFGQDLFNASLFDKIDEKGLLNDPNYNVLDKSLTDDYRAKKAEYCSYWIEDGSFLRMQNMTLGYTFPFSASNVWVKKARIYASAENLFVITKYSGVDPEINLDNLGLDATKPFPGVETNNNYPKPRTYSLGLSVQF